MKNFMVLLYLERLLQLKYLLVPHIDVTESIPTAMDVYQGKTTLEITYKDGIPVDSVVVFKD